MATDKRQFTLRLDENVFEAVKRMAEKERRSIATMIEVILIEYMVQSESLEEEDRREYFNLIFGPIEKDKS